MLPEHTVPDAITGSGDLGSVPRTSVVDEVTERLRKAILTGQIQPGERINVRSLEKSFGVSHIPIREALRKLEAEALVISSPQKSTTAAGLELDDLEGLYDLRRIIEAHVAGRSVAKMTDDDVANIHEKLAALESVSGGYESDAFWSCHTAFHSALLAAGSNTWVARTLDHLWQSAERYIRLSISISASGASFAAAVREHRAMVDAVDDRDAGRLQAILVQHLSRTENVIRDGYLAMREVSTTDQV